jgi:hypothetical protein
LPIAGLPIPPAQALQLALSEALQGAFCAPFPAGIEMAGIVIRHMATRPKKARFFILDFIVLLTSIKNDPF